MQYQLPVELYTRLLRQPAYKVIFLHRRNLPQAVVSVLIAEQTKLNSSTTYQFLPNAEEIQQALGKDETGWLL